MEIVSAKKILFRADGSCKLGLGHIMRCLSLAQYFRMEGINSLFVIKDHDRRIAELVVSYGFEVESLPANINCNEDSARTIEITKQNGVKILLTDLSNSEMMSIPDAYAQYFKNIKQAGIFSLAIDGLDVDCISKKTAVSADIVVIPYCGAEKANYHFSPFTRPLLGPSYFIFRQDIINAAAGNAGIIKGKAKNIFITMGGGDPCNLSVKALRAFAKNGRNGLNVRIAVGKAFSSSAVRELESIVANSSSDAYVLENMGATPQANNFVQSLFWADVVVTAAGLTKYEAILLGKPTLIISHDKIVETSSELFCRETGAIHLGCHERVSESRIIDAVNKLIEDDNLRVEMYERGRRILDGKGNERIAETLRGEY